MKNTFAHIVKTVEHELETHVPKFAQKHFLLAVSGGPDSVLLAHTFHTLKLRFSIAHVNYGLRGKESETDEKFVKALAEQLGTKYFVKKAGKNIFGKKGESIQMTARYLRYTFFEKLMEKENQDILVLAHHANDQVETLLLNFFRGCGIHGLTAMKVMEDKKFRPLLSIPKDLVVEALEQKNISFRTDSSNARNDYKRNFLRNVLLPQITGKWPGIEKTLLENIQRFRSAEEALAQYPHHVLDFSHPFNINTKTLLQDPMQLDLFRKKAVQAGFVLSPLEKLLRNTSTGTKTLESKQGKLEKKDETLYYFPFSLQKKNSIKLKTTGNQVSLTIPDPGCFKSVHEVVNALAVKGILKLRPWQAGDKMMPLGMRGFKKVSDILTDLKLTASQKAQVHVLCDEEKIVWLAGLRIDERVKLKDRKTSTDHLFLSII